MEKKIERNGTQVVINLSTSGEEWTKAQNKEFNKLSAKLNVPGFRKGHVPAAIAKQRINPADVLNDALFAVVNKAYAEVLKDESLAPIADPKLTLTKINENELECNVTIALQPTVTLGEYKGIKVELEEVKVTEEDLENEIKSELAKQASLMVKEDAAEENDTVIIDFKGYVDNTPFEGGEAKGYELKLGSNSFIPGFEEQLVGIKAGEEKEIEVKFPENYVESLAGKEAKFVIKCHEVKQTLLPELNDEFVSELSLDGVNNVEEYKAKLNADILLRKENQAKANRFNAIVDKIVDNATVDIADLLLENEANAQIENIKKQVESNGLKFEDYLKINNTDEEKFFADKKLEAAHNIKGMLVIEQICNDEKLIVDSKVLNDKYEELAKMYNMKIEDVRKALEPNQNQLLRNLRNELFQKFILENNE